MCSLYFINEEEWIWEKVSDVLFYVDLGFTVIQLTSFFVIYKILSQTRDCYVTYVEREGELTSLLNGELSSCERLTQLQIFKTR